jgi:hypothetical protein
MNELVGKRINHEQHYLVFKTDRGDVTYYADGDCCSESWFYHVLGVDALLGHTVLESTEIDVDDPDDDLSRQEVDHLYCIKLKTDAGYADVEFRNSSNGYYGGELVLVDAPDPYGWNKHIKDELAKTRFVPVTADYTAQQVAA